MREGEVEGRARGSARGRDSRDRIRFSGKSFSINNNNQQQQQQQNVSQLFAAYSPFSFVPPAFQHTSLDNKQTQVKEKCNE